MFHHYFTTFPSQTGQHQPEYLRQCPSPTEDWGEDQDGAEDEDEGGDGEGEEGEEGEERAGDGYLLFKSDESVFIVLICSLIGSCMVNNWDILLQLEDVPIPSSSHQQPSVWELDHEFYLASQQLDNKYYLASQQVNMKKEMEVNYLASQQVKKEKEVEEIKEEQIKPTRKILSSIMQEYQQSQIVQKSTVGSLLQKYEQTKDDEYKCGLCGFQSELRGKLEAHWESGCYYSNLEKKHNNLIGFQCAGCGFRDQSKTQIQLHFSVCRKLYAISWWN